MIDAAGMIKLYGGTGCLSRSDRLAKYNQRLRIEEELDRRSAGGGMRLLRIKQRISAYASFLPLGLNCPSR